MLMSVHHKTGQGMTTFRKPIEPFDRANDFGVPRARATPPAGSGVHLAAVSFGTEVAMDVSGANGRWGEMLSRWAIPDEIMSAAPEPPYFFDPNVFAVAADEAVARADDTPSDTAARDALPAGGTVLDVGCGAGAASLRLAPGRLVGVDSSAPLLDLFVARACRLGIDTSTVLGTWPEAADQAPAADVVVCHHVFYNVADLGAFATALNGHARRRVVIELTADHPMAFTAPYWKALYGLERPDRPVAADAVAALEELGYSLHRHQWSRRYQMTGESGNRPVESLARRLCLPASRHDELRRLLAETPPVMTRDVVTLWWNPTNDIH